ncbi:MULTISPECIES: DNA/RNA non-specific endonuclease [unclassified Lactococcus]|uniref:DNA/RNA non-specific endonuclease n=1 Tax=unclassified Lactococcus TaxID=2643510 RepID=UPI0011C8D702|nr:MULTISPECIES: DNA/RNA non-specific endonuclease [unclassified Lactococcus]MQW23877.1 DNA/RNA non-specific endonuclease [Lactococcus sp. dk101]TXK37193.1 DNA/RNA non-specific endonuclease [Lactococcus sp. dk310]TXK48124.1 DNA/RNA non-specific endonuclease [Lactococcus sp. dk322]
MKTLKQFVLKGTLLTSALVGLGFGTVAASAATVNYGRISDAQPTQSLSSSVLTSTVKAKLGAKITYNGHGAFIINNNYPSISIMKSSAYVSEGPLNRYGQASTAIAVLSFNTYTTKTRTSKTINPAGWHQLTLPGGKHPYLYNRGHSIGYALVGNLAGFDASEANKNNITAQTSWANQANGGTEGYGQNYYEGLVRNALRAHHTVKYLVRPIYAGTNAVPVGTEIEAQGIGYNMYFHVFVPNVEPGVKINYANGLATIVGKAASKTVAKPAAKPVVKKPVAKPVVKKPVVLSPSKSKRVVFVASHGTSKVYWYYKKDMPKSTILSNVVQMTEAQAVAKGKTHSKTE